MTEISAPAGSGKTFLLRSWIADAGLAERAGWVSVDRGEGDPQRFWLAVRDAVRSTVAGASLLGPLAAAPDLDGWEIVERLLGDLDALGDQIWLVIDDLHELRSDEALRQLELLLMRAPAELRFVLTTRHDMRLGLHRLRLEGGLTELRAADLRFTLDETRALFERAGVELSDSTLALLHDRTEGWAAGLRFAARLLHRHPDPERFAHEFSGSERTIAEYLLAEVLDHEPEEVRRCLLRTSILERVNAPLADLLTGGSGAHRILHELEEANAFVVSLDAERSWFRYHHLFADLLRLELRRTTPEELPALHTAAAEWFAAHGQPIEAIRHTQAAENWGLAARLLSDHWVGIYLDGGRATAHELLATFPAGAAAANPELVLIAAADELSGGSLEEAERYLALAARDSGSVAEDRRGRFELALTALRLVLAGGKNDVATVAREAERMLPTEYTNLVPPGLGDDLRAAALLILGMAGSWTGQRDDAERYLEQSLELSRRINRPYIELGALAHLAIVTVWRSRSLGVERSRQAIELARANGWSDDRFAGVAFAVLGGEALWCARLSQAEQWIERAEKALRADIDAATGLALQGLRGLLNLVQGRYEQALAAFRAAERLEALLMTHSLAPFVRADMLMAQIRIGQTDRVEHALAEMDDQALDAPELRAVVAVLRLAQERPEEAAAVLAPILDNPAPPATDIHWAIQALLLGAIALDALGDSAGAARALERALDLAEPDGLLLPFLLFPAADLLARHARADTAHAGLLSEILSLLSGRAPPARSGDVPAPSEPLSESELRVLRYLPTNLSMKEIANQRYVSTNTIKTHSRHIYAKLGVNSRSQAVERARALGLLSHSLQSR